MAASWDREALRLWGEGMGKQFAAKGANVRSCAPSPPRQRRRVLTNVLAVQVQLGPGVCVARIPRNGRNFEYLSGEDPFLGYALVQPAVVGIQSQGVIANVKHYVNNNQVQRA